MDVLASVQDQLIRSAVVIVGAVVVWLVIARTAARYVARIGRDEGFEAAERHQRAETLWVGIRRVILAIVILVVVLTVMNIWAIPIGTFVAVGSAVGVAVGFGAQSLVKDVIAGFFILLENQFSLGDVVHVASVSGTVEQMRLRVTVLRDLEGNVHFVPNGEITVASNYTHEFARVVIDVGISYGQDADHALDVLEGELAAMFADGRMLEEPQVLGVQELGDSAVVLRGLMVVAPQDRWSMRREALRRIKVRFDAEGIEIPFPQLSVHVDRAEPAD